MISGSFSCFNLHVRQFSSPRSLSPVATHFNHPARCISLMWVQTVRLNITTHVNTVRSMKLGSLRAAVLILFSADWPDCQPSSQLVLSGCFPETSET